jgi:hypothetical protein
MIATIRASDQGAGAIRIVTLYPLSVERSDLEGLAGASAVKITFAGEAGMMSAARNTPCAAE